MYIKYKDGWIEIFCGPMYAGKTESLVRAIKRLGYARVKIQVFKPIIDNRYSEINIATHDGQMIKSTPVTSVAEIKSKIEPDTQVVAIDEVQFFDKGIIQLAENLANNNVRVILAGLDTDFRGEPFPVMGELLVRAEFIHKLSAFCHKCGAPATKTQRLVNGKPAKFTDPIIQVGSIDSYEARCRKCHEIEK